MTDVLLISEDYIKTNSNISDNLWGKFLLPAIRESQDIYLQGVIGTELYKSILDNVKNDTIKEEKNVKYRTLLDDYIQPYLLYQVLTNIIPIIGTKLGNLGTVVTDDDKANNIMSSERDRLSTYYEYRSNFYKDRLQEYLMDNKLLFKELKKCTKFMKPNLETSESTGIWLGGKMGKRIVK